MAWSRLACLLALALGGCSMHVHRVAMDPARLDPPSAEVRLACGYRLQDVVDARPAGDRAGGLGNHMFVFDDATAVVRGQLEAAGLRADASDAKTVSVRIVQLYLTQNTITKIPVAVYAVTVDGQPAFLVRSQKATMNWNSTENEAYAAYARVLADANAQLVRRLNAGCAGA